MASTVRSRVHPPFFAQSGRLSFARPNTGNTWRRRLPPPHASVMHRALCIGEVCAAIFAQLNDDVAALAAAIGTCRGWFGEGVRVLWHSPPAEALRSVVPAAAEEGAEEYGDEAARWRRGRYIAAVSVVRIGEEDRHDALQWPCSRLSEVRVDGRLARDEPWFAGLLARCGPSLSSIVVGRSHQQWHGDDDEASFGARNDALVLRLAARGELRRLDYAELTISPHGMRHLLATVDRPFAKLEELRLDSDPASALLLLTLLLLWARASLARLHVSLPASVAENIGFMRLIAAFRSLTVLLIVVPWLAPPFSAATLLPLGALAQLRDVALLARHRPTRYLPARDDDWRALVHGWPRLESLKIGLLIALSPGAVLELGAACRLLRYLHLPAACSLADVLSLAHERGTSPVYPQLQRLAMKRAGNRVLRDR